MLFVNDVVYPDAAIHEKKKADKEIYALFTSDLHVGSNRFLQDNFEKFIDWLNGKLNYKQEVGKIKYLFITGDTVDGVGVFPGQEEFLDIKDIKEQYRRLAELLRKIRKDIRIIICPGQHDAVRVAEPQPSIDESYAPEIHEMKNVSLVTNPAYVSLAEGFDVLMYHGASFHGIIRDMERLRLNGGHDKPANVVKELLKRRHLAPSHASTTYIPGERDPLLIRKIPDIITTGDLHKPDIENYNNIMIISNSCWQARTPFEEKVGNHPDPCKVSMLNLKTRELKILDFS
jgi:DNA polymerase II small subunit